VYNIQLNRNLQTDNNFDRHVDCFYSVIHLLGDPGFNQAAQMKKYVKIYFDYFHYGEQSMILCERPHAVRANDIHHILYKSQGGKDEIGNLIALCGDCHNRAQLNKGD